MCVCVCPIHDTCVYHIMFLGVQCPNFCSGHGRCINTTGQYEGVVCGGNSDGQPCASSFIYRNKIYTGCTRDGREAIDNELWCSTTANYDKDKMWGYCICGKSLDGAL